MELLYHFIRQLRRTSVFSNDLLSNLFGQWRNWCFLASKIFLHAVTLILSFTSTISSLLCTNCISFDSSSRSFFSSLHSFFTSLHSSYRWLQLSTSALQRYSPSTASSLSFSTSAWRSSHRWAVLACSFFSFAQSTIAAWRLTSCRTASAYCSFSFCSACASQRRSWPITAPAWKQRAEEFSDTFSMSSEERVNKKYLPGLSIVHWSS